MGVCRTSEVIPLSARLGTRDTLCAYGLLSCVSSPPGTGQHTSRTQSAVLSLLWGGGLAHLLWFRGLLRPVVRGQSAGVFRGICSLVEVLRSTFSWGLSPFGLLHFVGVLRGLELLAYWLNSVVSVGSLC